MGNLTGQLVLPLRREERKESEREGEREREGEKLVEYSVSTDDFCSIGRCLLTFRKPNHPHSGGPLPHSFSSLNFLTFLSLPFSLSLSLSLPLPLPLSPSLFYFFSLPFLSPLCFIFIFLFRFRFLLLPLSLHSLYQILMHRKIF